jgi:hypothetical protein
LIGEDDLTCFAVTVCVLIQIVSEIWSLTLREVSRVRVFENRVLRKIFGPKWGEVTEGRRKLNNEELHDLYSSPIIIRMIKSRRMRWVGDVARMEEKRNAI